MSAGSDALIDLAVVGAAVYAVDRIFDKTSGNSKGKKKSSGKAKKGSKNKKKNFDIMEFGLPGT